MPIDPTPVTDWLLFFIAVCTVIGLFARWITKGAKRREASANRQRDEMVSLIKQVTSQIQPRNGGGGWSDMHKDVKELLANQSVIVTDVGLLKQAVLQLEDDMDGMK